MPLTPPERWGTGNPLRRLRLSEAFITQTHGGAAGDVVTSMEFPTPASNDNKTGTVAGALALSGTVVGKEGATGTVAGAIALSGTITGKEGALGAVTGTLALSGTTAGKKGASGATAGTVTLSGMAEGTEGRTVTVAGQITLDGTVIGTKSDPDGPVAPESTGGGGGYYRYQQPPAPKPQPIERRSGKVRGTVTVRGYIRGRKGAATAARSTVTARCEIRGGKGAAGDAWMHTVTRAAAHGTGISMVPHNHIRQMREDAELMLLI